VDFIDADGKRRLMRILKLMGHHGLHHSDVEEATAAATSSAVIGMDQLFIRHCATSAMLKR
jgi:predicted membrane GTPase involved in stress response